MAKTKIRAHVWISGKVQGVAFRHTLQTEAKQTQVTGWVKNLGDGRVEAVFEGFEDPVEDMVAWCQHGPDAALVKNLEVEYEEVEGLASFEIV